VNGRRDLRRLKEKIIQVFELTEHRRIFLLETKQEWSLTHEEQDELRGLQIIAKCRDKIGG